MSGITKIIVSAVIVAAWITAGCDAFHVFGPPLELQQFNTALSALIVASLIAGLVWLLTGPGFYRAMRLGEVIGAQRERRRAARASTPRETRVEVTTG